MRGVAFIENTEQQHLGLLANCHSSPFPQSVRIWTDNMERVHSKYISSLTCLTKAFISYSFIFKIHGSQKSWKFFLWENLYMVICS